MSAKLFSPLADGAADLGAFFTLLAIVLIVAGQIVQALKRGTLIQQPPAGERDEGGEPDLPLETQPEQRQAAERPSATIRPVPQPVPTETAQAPQVMAARVLRAATPAERRVAPGSSVSAEIEHARAEETRRRVDLREAVIMREILGPPLALRRPDSSDPPLGLR